MVIGDWILGKIYKKQLALPKPHDPSLWTGGKFLGKGGNGQATLWTYIGTKNPTTEKFPHLVSKKVVMKTALEVFALQSFRAEYYAMKELLKRKEYHITQIITDLGRYDKIYLEYCEGGDLEREIGSRRNMGAPFMEEELWRMLVCLAKAAIAMARDDPPDKQFLNVDMHAGNVLIGEIGGTNHSCLSMEPQYKTSDFGLVIEWDSKEKRPHNSPDGIDAVQHNQAEFFFGEQFDDSTPPQTLGEKCNTWGIGVIMYQATLISSKSQSKHTLETNLSDRYKSPFGAGTLPVGWKYGKELETMNKYSEELRITIQHCLMEDYELRISSSDLLEKALLFAARNTLNTMHSIRIAFTAILAVTVASLALPGNHGVSELEVRNEDIDHPDIFKAIKSRSEDIDHPDIFKAIRARGDEVDHPDIFKIKKSRIEEVDHPDIFKAIKT